MYLLECVFMLNHCMLALRWGVIPCMRFSLLGIAHLVEGSLFQVQGVFEKMTLIEVDFRRKLDCWL